MIRTRLGILLGFGTLALALAGEFRFGGPEVAKLDWDTRSLQAADLDGDGRLDLAVLNNARAQVELLYQRAPGVANPRRPPENGRLRWEPVLEDARFERRSLVTGISMYQLAIADLNGDGRADLAYTGTPDTLTVRFQAADGTFDHVRKFDVLEPLQWPSSLQACDLDGDGRADLMVAGQDAVLIYTQTPQGELTGPVRYALPDGNCTSFRWVDLDGDGGLDLCYLVSAGNAPLRVRLRQAGGELGPELAFSGEAVRDTLVPLPLGVAGATRWGLAGVQRRSGQIVTYALERAPRPAGLQGLVPRVFATGVDGGGDPSFVLGDFDGDGATDMVLANSRDARMQLLRQQPGGGFGEARSFPGFSDVRALAAADFNGDKRAELLVLSQAEQCVGWSAWGDNGRLSYPLPIPLEGKPEALAAGDLDGDGVPEMVVVTSVERLRQVFVLHHPLDGKTRNLHKFEIKDLTRAPVALRLLDVDQDGRIDVVILTPGQPMRVLLQAADGRFAAPANPGNPARGLLSEVEPGQLTWGDVNQDGRAEMLVAGRGFARSLRLDATGAPEFLDQYNARENDAEVAAALPLGLADGQAPGILLYDRKSSTLQLLSRDSAGVYRFADSLPLEPMQLLGAEVRDLDRDGRPDLLLFARKRIYWLPFAASDYRVTILAPYETDLEDVNYQALAAADLDGDGAPELLATDSGNNHLLEILYRTPAGNWRSGMHFAVFETDPHARTRRTEASEPREMLVRDFSGDGRPDLALLIHDRLLLYPQLPPPAPAKH